MPPKKNKAPKKIEISEDLLIHGDDSSGGEDYDVTDSELEKNIKDFATKGIIDEISKISYVLEDRGRKVLYSKDSRSGYEESKKKFLKYSEEDFSKITIDVVKDALVKSLIKGCGKKINQDTTNTTAANEAVKDIIEKYKNKESDLIRLLLKQSNTEFVLPEFQALIDNFAKLLSKKYFSDGKKQNDENKSLPYNSSYKDFFDSAVEEWGRNYRGGNGEYKDSYRLVYIQTGKKSAARNFLSNNNKQSSNFNSNSRNQLLLKIFSGNKTETLKQFQNICFRVNKK